MAAKFYWFSGHLVIPSTINHKSIHHNWSLIFYRHSKLEMSIHYANWSHSFTHVFYIFFSLCLSAAKEHQTEGPATNLTSQHGEPPQIQRQKEMEGMTRDTLPSHNRAFSLTSCCPPTWPSDCADWPGYPGQSHALCAHAIIMRLEHEWRSSWRYCQAQ